MEIMITDRDWESSLDGMSSNDNDWMTMESE